MESEKNGSNQLVPLVNPPDRLRKYLKGLSTVLIVCGFLMITLGVNAIGAMAYYSYIAVPVWSGVFVSMTGILFRKPIRDRLTMLSMILLISVSACMSLASIVIGIRAVFREEPLRCNPQVVRPLEDCRTVHAARAIIDSLIALDALFALAACLVVACIGVASALSGSNQLGPFVNPPDRLRKHLKESVIVLIVCGSLMIALGVTAISVTAYLSYIAVPVWSGMFVIMTGILCRKPSSDRLTMLLMILLISVSACMSLSSGVIGIVAASNEKSSYSDCYPAGWPGRGEECRAVHLFRVAIDTLIAIDALFALVTCLVVGCIVCYKTFAGCRTCCFGDEPINGSNADMYVYLLNNTADPLIL